MIVSQKFVWAHLPKTGGDATATMIQQVPRLVVLADHLDDNAKHLSFSERMGSINGKLLVANIRRLPAWTFSLVSHVARFGRWPDYVAERPPPAAAVAADAEADRHLQEIIGDFEVDVWLRQEHLEDDLVRFLGTVTTLTVDEEAAIRSVGRVNEQRRARRLRRVSADTFFSPAEVETLYASNPRWAAIERRVYGEGG